MRYDGMLGFLTEENLRLHLSYLEDLKLKYSILIKSCPQIGGKNISELYKIRVKNDIRHEALALLSEIEAHELYFSSFSEKITECKAIRDYYSSEEAFKYEIFEAAINSKDSFLFVCLDVRGKPNIVCGKESFDLFYTYKPVLAIDMCEHSYFYDYAFERDEYLRRSITHLNLSRVIKP